MEKGLTRLRAHTHTRTPVRAHTPTLSYMHSRTKETKEGKKKQTNKNVDFFFFFFPQGSTCSILPEQQVAAAGACLPGLSSACPACCGMCRRAGCRAQPLSPWCPSADGRHAVPMDKVLVSPLLPGGRSPGGGRHGAARQRGGRVLWGEGLARLESGTDPEGMALAWSSKGCGVMLIATAFLFECLCSSSRAGAEEGGPINICITPRGKRKRFFTYYSSQLYTTEGVRHKFTCGRKQAIHRYIPTKNPCDKTIIYAW